MKNNGDLIRSIDGGYKIINPDTWEDIAIVYDKDKLPLLAAAPELLAALEFCAKMLDDDGGKVQGKMYSDCLSPDSDDMTGIEYIRAAIAKAKGE